MKANELGGQGMKANGINAELALFTGWVLEDETKVYFFNCSDCAFAWIVENKPELIENAESENWDKSKRWCGHAEIKPILVISKSLLDIAESIDYFTITMKEGTNDSI